MLRELHQLPIMDYMQLELVQKLQLIVGMYILILMLKTF